MGRWEREKISYKDDGYRIRKRSDSHNGINLYHPNIIAYTYWTAEDCIAQLECNYFDEQDEEDNDLPFKINEFYVNPHLQRMFLDDLSDILGEFDCLNSDSVDDAISAALDEMRENERCGSPTNIDPESPYVYELDVGVRMSTLWDNFEDYEQHILCEFKGNTYDRVFVSETCGDIFYSFVDSQTLTTLRPSSQRQLFDVDADTWRD